VPVDAASLAGAIRAATALSSAELRAMGRRGRAEAIARFDWSAIAAQFAAAYDWILGRGSAPACLHL
jgi:glycosyltransferase involved in cell wall biosynthesis